MKVMMIAIGSRGDVQPMISLGLGLAKRGHQVTYGAPPNFRSWIEKLGFEYFPVGRDMQEWLQSESKKGYSKIQIFKMLIDWLRTEVMEQFRVLEPVINKDFDAVLCTGFSQVSADLAEAANVRHIGLHYHPFLLPTFDYPPSLGIPEGFPRIINRFFHWLSAAPAQGVKELINAKRVSLGLRPLRKYNPFVIRGNTHIAAFDTVLAGIPKDAARLYERVYHQPDVELFQSSFLMWPQPAGNSPEVERFLAAGKAPIYFGFGSMSDENPRENVRKIMQAVEELGERAIICQGWSEAHGLDVPASCLLVKEASHADLFPRCRGIVHHGGAGTTAAASQSGVPQFVIPHLGDQFFWGKRVHALGIAVKPLEKTGFTAKRLKAGLEKLLDSPVMIEKARAVRREMLQKNGIEEICMILEGLVKAGEAAA